MVAGVCTALSRSFKDVYLALTVWARCQAECLQKTELMLHRMQTCEDKGTEAHRWKIMGHVSEPVRPTKAQGASDEP